MAEGVVFKNVREMGRKERQEVREQAAEEGE
jgi:hypothetical protein